MDPQGILIAQYLGTELDVSMWHVIDVEGALTWCGMFLTQGSDRRLWIETPQDRRCMTCTARFEEHDVIRGPGMV
jgi:hypothetical protein